MGSRFIAPANTRTPRRRCPCDWMGLLKRRIHLKRDAQATVSLPIRARGRETGNASPRGLITGRGIVLSNRPEGWYLGGRAESCPSVASASHRRDVWGVGGAPETLRSTRTVVLRSLLSSSSLVNCGAREMCRAMRAFHHGAPRQPMTPHSPLSTMCKGLDSPSYQ
jgi:hypothetical protein